jgi:hypothetical protein
MALRNQKRSTEKDEKGAAMLSRRGGRVKDESKKLFLLH